MVIGCRKNTTTIITEHPEYQNFLSKFDNLTLPLTLQWQANSKKFEWSAKQKLDTNLTNLFVDSLHSKEKLAYVPYGKILVKDEFAVLLLGITDDGKEDMPGWAVLSVRKDGQVLGKEHFRFRKKTAGKAKLAIENDGVILFEKDIVFAEMIGIKTRKNFFKYKIDEQGFIKEKDEEVAENLTEYQYNFLNQFPQSSLPFYISSNFLHSVRAMRLDENLELLHENWYRPLENDTIFAYFPKLQNQIGDGIQVVSGAYKVIYKHKDFSVGLVVTRQAGNQIRSAVTGFHLFTFHRKTQKVIDLLPMVAYVVETVPEDNSAPEVTLGVFQFFEDLNFSLRYLKGISESSKDNVKSGYITEMGTIIIMN